jgi:hypothetical protein
LKIYFSTSGGGGSLQVYAANGLTQSALTCGGSIPTVSNQLIGSYTTTTSTSQTQIFTFTANANYSQLWIYPVASSATQFNLLVTTVLLCPSCRNTVVYNNGTLPVSVSAGDIFVGSSAGTDGSGVVGVQPDVATNLVAGDGITIQAETEITVNSAGSFLAQIVPCGESGTSIGTDAATIYDTIVASSLSTVDSLGSVSDSSSGRIMTGPGNVMASPASGPLPVALRIYPTISTGRISVTGSPADLWNSDIMVIDESGRIVFTAHQAADTNVSLDLGYLKNGLYFLQLKKGPRQIVRKIIISK